MFCGELWCRGKEIGLYHKPPWELAPGKQLSLLVSCPKEGIEQGVGYTGWKEYFHLGLSRQVYKEKGESSLGTEVFYTSAKPG